MHFDDRLATVLRNRATGDRSARTQFRQLIDLLGERQQGGDKALRTAAYLRLIALGELIPVRERTSIVGEAGWRFRTPDLVRWFGDAHPHIAAAALARADLTGEEWQEIIPAFPIHARGFLRNRKDLPRQAVEVLDRLGVADMALPRPEPLELTEFLDPAFADLPPAPAPLRLSPLPGHDAAAGKPGQTADSAEDHYAAFRQTGDGIRALVDRIEAFKRARESRDESGVAERQPARPSEDRKPPAVIDFRADIHGRIDWAGGGLAPMLVGLDLTMATDIASGFAARHPVRGLAVSLRGAGAITGDWIVDAVPRFSSQEGRFGGYVGRLRRAAPPRASARQKEADKLRQLLHELRTPVNAMQGYAEIIQQQMVGPVPHEYRAIAAAITGDAARILAGFDELDRLARLETGAAELDRGTADLAAIVRGHVTQLQKVLSPRVARLDAEFTIEHALTDIADQEAERLSWRLLATLAGATAAGERIALSVSDEGGSFCVSAALPTALRTLEDPFAAELRASAGPLSSGIFGAGFSLRLARAEARAAGGELSCTGGRMTLLLPLADAQPARSETPARADGARP
ncbi:histidine kinase dimerization/phospho-acceptor domain-containing protein [Qipengyuania sp.]|uniref:histidine kinase dimerization/phospho-acceptor domain-containing protein n=1 Tax=Qipengyuania sp. TaxID=2004515 RepID=UPI003735B6FE